jgi:hypothetical protein
MVSKTWAKLIIDSVRDTFANSLGEQHARGLKRSLFCNLESAKGLLRWLRNGVKCSLKCLHFFEGVTLFRTKFDELVAHIYPN